MTVSVFAALQQHYPTLPAERLAVEHPADVVRAKQLDEHLGEAITAVRFYHNAGRDPDDWLEITLTSGDTWTILRTVAEDKAVLYWDKKKTMTRGDAYGQYFYGALPAFLRGDAAARRAMSEADDHMPYSDPMGFDLFG